MQLHFLGLIKKYPAIPLLDIFFIFDIMTELQKLIEESGQDKQKLLEYYETLPGCNQSLVKVMKKETRKRDEYIQYEIWKMLADQERMKYNQDLSLKGEEKEEPIKEKPAKKTISVEAPVTEENKGTQPEVDDIVRKGHLYNQRAILSNSLINFAENDNEGRRKIVEQMEKIDKEIQTINEKMSGGTPPAKHKFLKTEEEKAKLSLAEIIVYKKKLSEKRSRIKKDLLKSPDNPNKDKWEYILELINQEYKSL